MTVNRSRLTTTFHNRCCLFSINFQTSVMRHTPPVSTLVTYTNISCVFWLDLGLWRMSYINSPDTFPRWNSSKEQLQPPGRQEAQAGQTPVQRLPWKAVQHFKAAGRAQQNKRTMLVLQKITKLAAEARSSVERRTNRWHTGIQEVASILGYHEASAQKRCLDISSAQQIGIVGYTEFWKTARLSW